MAKPELGAKHTCQGCGAKFYDLNKSPIVCPKCGTEVVDKTEIPAPVVAQAAEKETEDVEVAVVEEDDAPEVISLEEAEAEEIDDEISAVADVDIDESEVQDIVGDDEFLDDDDEGGSDVSDIIVAPVGEDET